MSFFFAIKKFIFDTLFPIECLGCGREGEWLCAACRENIKPDHHSLRGEFLDRIFTFYSYDNEFFKKIIHGLKYKFVEDLASPLGTLLIRELKRIEGQIGKPDFIVPVPLHRKRLLERGFNQSELLALKISEYFGWPVENTVLKRSRATAPQVSQDEAGRKENVGNAFSVVDSLKILNKKIVLLDDVTTTGATMEECAKVLKNAGAKEVLGLALAKG
ncbi:ComF family protein [Candidatus Falkowbacteria bacterium]|nr:ComF family protein [Candidatus Falkowbacteria bacterium]